MDERYVLELCGCSSKTHYFMELESDSEHWHAVATRAESVVLAAGTLEACQAAKRLLEMP